MYSNFCPPGLLRHLFRHSDVTRLCPYMGKKRQSLVETGYFGLSQDKHLL
nr:MAG TPA: hypothetical protein [Caudoviricetes sp.]